MKTLKMRLPGYREPWIPDELQKIALKYLIEHAAAALLLDPGAGKTSVTMAAFNYLRHQGVAERMLVLAPVRPAQLVWPAETKKWKDFEDLNCEFIHGADKEERLWESKAEIVVTNFDSLPWLFDIEKFRHSRGVRVEANRVRAKKLGFDTLVIDELSKFRHPKSIRFGTMKDVVNLFSRRWGLTGSIAANGLMGLFGECLVLDEGRTFGKFITHYRRLYFDQNPYGFGFTLKEGADEKIYERMAPLCLRLDETMQPKAAKIPAVKLHVISVKLPPKIQAAYEDLQEDLITKVKEKTVTAANSGVASMKCRQIVSGAIYVEDSIEDMLKKHKEPVPKKRGMREWDHLHDEKINALEELVEELEGQPLLVSYDFKHSLVRLQERFKSYKCAFIGGGVGDKAAAKAEADWLDAKLDIMFVHPQSAAHGLNLQHSGKGFPRHVCWFDPIWDFELYDQLNRRIRRRGNLAKQVFIHMILAKDTLDERVLGTLQAKNRSQNLLYDALLEMAGMKK